MALYVWKSITQSQTPKEGYSGLRRLACALAGGGKPPHSRSAGCAFDGGGKVMFVTLPSGQLFFQSWQANLKCPNSTVYPFTFYWLGTFKADGFSFLGLYNKRFEGKFAGEAIHGTVAGPDFAHTSAQGQIACPGGQSSFKANRLGAGKAVILQAWRELSASPPFTGFAAHAGRCHPV